MAPSSGELWGHHLMPQSITVDCLLPNGVIIPLNCYRNALLETIKSKLWREAASYPLFNILKDPDSYKFVSITQDAEREEFYDESRRLCDLRLFQPVLKVVEPEGNKEEKIANSKISQCLGVSASGPKLHEFDDMKDPEVVEFRRSIFSFVQKCFNDRNVNGLVSQALYQYPPEVENSSVLPPNFVLKLEKGYIRIAVWSLSNQLEKQKYTVAVQPTSTPSEIIRETIYKKIRSWDRYKTQEEKMQAVEEHQSAYVLKVAGSDQHLLKECPISQYKYIRACIAKRSIPHLMLMCKKKVYETVPVATFHVPSYMKKSLKNDHHGKKNELLWNTERSSFRVHIIAANYVNAMGSDQVFVRAGLYHGTEPLCPVLDTKPIQIQSQNHPRWDEKITFELHTIDLPRAAKLCVSVCAVKRRNKNREDTTMLCWGNVNLFDYKCVLLSGKLSLYLRQAPREHNDLLFPLGETGSNYVGSRDSPQHTPVLKVDFERPTHSNVVVVYPTADEFKDYAAFLEKLNDPRQNKFNPNANFVPAQVEISEFEWSQLQDILKRDPLADISEQEKSVMWRLRRHCSAIPDILPRFLDAVKWNSRDDITQAYMLLNDWPKVSPQTALELLDCKYSDPVVRKLAVAWLSDMSDEDLSQYLLQLVQTLKYEPYLDNSLSKLLLRRALLNRKIGHFFFWHLKCELQSQSACAGTQLHIRFGLLLEAFCRGLGPYLKDLIKQVEALDKLTSLTNSLKDRKTENARDRLSFLTDQIRQDDYKESLQCFHSPLDNNVVFGELIVSECKVMNSAKKPLWLVWKNHDPLAEIQYQRNAIIFKNGDDLRQDMLTLQVIKIMDHIWHMEGMDLRMTPYSCLATGNQVGIIEFVHNAKTVYNIQRQGNRLAAMQFDSTQLYKWISVVSQKGGGQDRLDQAIETFTLSCAGYCVATFILGIGDRHPDNIMVSEDGQIFHIDFGHFLGHFKKKFGITRERVPFVLTDDFLLVIGKGKDNPKRSEEFAKFQEYCGQAYLALRRHSNLLITLFTMMLPAGITELSSIDNISYLRQTLAVEKNEEEALKYFQTVFNEAYEGAWTTKVDWFFHSVRHGVSVTT